MKTLLLLVLLADVPQPSGIVYGRCDYIEINHYHGEGGAHNFTQFIGWSMREYPPGFHVDWWRMRTGTETWSRDGRGNWVLSFFDGNTFVIIVTPHRYERSTRYDPEVVDRHAVPRDQRFGWNRPLDGQTARR